MDSRRNVGHLRQTAHSKDWRYCVGRTSPPKCSSPSTERRANPSHPSRRLEPRAGFPRGSRLHSRGRLLHATQGSADSAPNTRLSPPRPPHGSGSPQTSTISSKIPAISLESIASLPTPTPTPAAKPAASQPPVSVPRLPQVRTPFRRISSGPTL